MNADDDPIDERIRAVATRHNAVLAGLSQEPDPEALPSSSSSTWVTVHAPNRAPVVRPGKWLIFQRDPEAVDALWLLIRAAVREGRLYAAKSSGRDRAAAWGGEWVVCVYTRDCQDLADVRRARQVLRELGVAVQINYKADGAAEGEYLASG